MADEATNAILLSIASKHKEALSQQKIAADEASRRAADTAKKAVEAALTAATKRIEQQVEKGITALSGSKSRGPAVIAILGVLFVILLAYAVGWTMGHAGVSVSALLGL